MGVPVRYLVIWLLAAFFGLVSCGPEEDATVPPTSEAGASLPISTSEPVCDDVFDNVTWTDQDALVPLQFNSDCSLEDYEFGNLNMTYCELEGDYDGIVTRTYESGVITESAIVRINAVQDDRMECPEPGVYRCRFLQSGILCSLTE